MKKTYTVNGRSVKADSPTEAYDKLVGYGPYRVVTKEEIEKDLKKEVDNDFLDEVSDFVVVCEDGSKTYIWVRTG